MHVQIDVLELVVSLISDTKTLILTEKDKNQGFNANGHRRCDAATTASGTITSIDMIL